MRVEKELVVNAPVDRVFQLWTDFERFPRFMHHVESVTQTGDNTYHWKAKLGGRDVEWDAKVVGMVPNRSVTWRSTSGAENAGAVNLAAQGNVTLMQVVIEYEPSWFVGLVASVTGEMARSVEEDLDRFKRLAEGVAGPEPTREERMNADKGTDVGKETRARLENQPSRVQGATSQSVGPGNTGAYGPSAARAGLARGGAPSESGTAAADQPASSTSWAPAGSTS